MSNALTVKGNAVKEGNSMKLKVVATVKKWLWGTRQVTVEEDWQSWVVRGSLRRVKLFDGQADHFVVVQLIFEQGEGTLFLKGCFLQDIKDIEVTATE